MLYLSLLDRRLNWTFVYSDTVQPSFRPSRVSDEEEGSRLVVGEIICREQTHK